jgi:hypothetical protein
VGCCWWMIENKKGERRGGREARRVYTIISMTTTTAISPFLCPLGGSMTFVGAEERSEYLEVHYDILLMATRFDERRPAVRLLSYLMHTRRHTHTHTHKYTLTRCWQLTPAKSNNKKYRYHKSCVATSLNGIRRRGGWGWQKESPCDAPTWLLPPQFPFACWFVTAARWRVSALFHILPPQYR